MKVSSGGNVVACCNGGARLLVKVVGQAKQFKVRTFKARPGSCQVFYIKKSCYNIFDKEVGFIRALELSGNDTANETGKQFQRIEPKSGCNRKIIKSRGFPVRSFFLFLQALAGQIIPFGAIYSRCQCLERQRKRIVNHSFSGPDSG